MLLSLVTWLWYVNPCLLYVFATVLFVIAGKRIRIVILLYSVISTYDMITSLSMKLDLYEHTALWSFPYLICYLSEFINNQTEPMGKTEGDTLPYFFTPPLSCRLVITAFENFEYS